MVFADLFFIYVFLPLCLICYGLAKKLSTKNIVLIVFSLIFYAWGEPLWILLLLFSSFFNRFIGILIEHYAGKFPAWLAPVQVRVMPVKTDNEELTAYAQEICNALEEKNVRVELDDRSEKLGYRMREGQVQKVPYLLVVGFNEKEDRTVSFRLHGEKDTTVLPLDEFVEKIDNEIKNKLRTHIGAEEK